MVNLHETQRTSKLNINFLKINVDDIVLVIYEKVPRHFWRIAIVTRLSPSRDSEVRAAIVRIAKTNAILKCPVNNLFAVENIYHETSQTDKASHREIASLFPCCPVNREYLWKKTQIEEKANSALQQLRTDFLWWGKSVLMLCHLYVFIKIYSLIMTKQSTSIFNCVTSKKRLELLLN